MADLNSLAARIVREATEPQTKPVETKHATAGRSGGLKGGKARASALSPERRKPAWSRWLAVADLPAAIEPTDWPATIERECEGTEALAAPAAELDRRLSIGVAFAAVAGLDREHAVFAENRDVLRDPRVQTTNDRQRAVQTDPLPVSAR
jgi:hypothetical protein